MSRLSRLSLSTNDASLFFRGRNGSWNKQIQSMVSTSQEKETISSNETKKESLDNSTPLKKNVLDGIRKIEKLSSIAFQDESQTIEEELNNSRSLSLAMAEQISLLRKCHEESKIEDFGLNTMNQQQIDTKTLDFILNNYQEISRRIIHTLSSIESFNNGNYTSFPLDTQKDISSVYEKSKALLQTIHERSFCYNDVTKLEIDQKLCLVKDYRMYNEQFAIIKKTIQDIKTIKNDINSLKRKTMHENDSKPISGQNQNSKTMVSSKVVSPILNVPLKKQKVVRDSRISFSDDNMIYDLDNDQLLDRFNRILENILGKEEEEKAEEDHSIKDNASNLSDITDIFNDARNEMLSLKNTLTIRNVKSNKKEVKVEVKNTIAKTKSTKLKKPKSTAVHDLSAYDEEDENEGLSENEYVKDEFCCSDSEITPIEGKHKPVKETVVIPNLTEEEEEDYLDQNSSMIASDEESIDSELDDAFSDVEEEDIKGLIDDSIRILEANEEEEEETEHDGDINDKEGEESDGEEENEIEAESREEENNVQDVIEDDSSIIDDGLESRIEEEEEAERREEIADENTIMND